MYRYRFQAEKAQRYLCVRLCAISNKVVTNCEIRFSNWQNYVRISTVKSVGRTPILRRLFVNEDMDIFIFTNLELQRKERGGKQRFSA